MKVKTDSERIGTIADALRKQIFERIHLRGIAVFLAGASHTTSFSVRDALRRQLVGARTSSGSIVGLDVYYPEELFEELLTGNQRRDLLELENMLARSVHAVVIVLESAGAIAELGAFANHRELQDRLVVVVNKKHQRDKSFIMLGPVAYLRRNTNSQVIYHDLRHAEIEKLGEDVRRAVRKVSKGAQVDTTVRNPIAAQHYLRAAIHAFGRVSRETLLNVVKGAGVADKDDVSALVETSLSILLRQSEVELVGGMYSLTDAGWRRLRNMFRLELQGTLIEDVLDRIRVDVMTWTLRRPTRLAV